MSIIILSIKKIVYHKVVSFLLVALCGTVLAFPLQSACREGAEKTDAAAAPSAKEDGVSPPWVIRSCCEMPASSFQTDDGMSMADTVALLHVETALRIVDDAVAAQKIILEDKGECCNAEGNSFRQIEADLRKARRNLAEQSKLLARVGTGTKYDLLKSIEDAGRLVKMDLSIQRKIRKADGARSRAALLKRLDLVARHLERALADHRRILAASGENGS